MTATELSMFTGVSLQEALHRVLVLAESYHLDGHGCPDDRGLNSLCLEIAAQHISSIEPEDVESYIGSLPPLSDRRDPTDLEDAS